MHNTYRDLLADQYRHVERAVSLVARRHRLDRDETDELESAVNLKLVERGYLVLRKFEGRSQLATYLVTVVTRVCLDLRAARWGKWRASVPARRLGATAIRLERLLQRDGLPFDQACEVLRTNCRVPETVGELARMRDELPVRHRVRFCGADALALIPAHAPDDQRADGMPAREALEARLARAVAALAEDERRLIQLRFDRGWTVARIAGELGLPPKAAYRTFDRIFRQLRRALVTAVSRSAAPGA